MKQTYKPEITPRNGFMVHDKPGFQNWVKQTFKYKKTGNKNGLFDHQRLVRDYMQSESPYRGILLYHALGVGKTRSAIAISEVFVNKKDVVIMLPASLHKNFVEELYRFGNEAYVKQQHWEKNGNNWVGKGSRTPNYSKLNDKDRKSLDSFIDQTIAKRIKLIKYNGMTRKSFQEMIQRNPRVFDNKVIIVDEVHNFISRVVSGSAIAKTMYKHIMDASNSKVVCLSGTPLINYAIEFPLLINFLAGYLEAFELSVKKKCINQMPSIRAGLDADPQVLMWNFDEQKLKLRIKPCPDGFVKSAQGFLKSGDVVNAIDKIKTLITTLDIPLRVNGMKIVKTTALPFEEKRFNERFIDFTAENQEGFVKEEDTLLAATRGLVSYYNHYNPEDYPMQEELKIVDIPMSDSQFENYRRAREIELDLEKKKRFGSAKTKKSMWDNISLNLATQSKKKLSNYFKVFSRTIGNFDFADVARRNKTERSEVIIRRARERGYFSTGLAERGPKYLRILNTMRRSNGPVVIYSQYRNDVGVGVMKEVLDAHQWSELKVRGEHVVQTNPNASKRYIVFTNQTPEKTRILMDIFNGNIANLPNTIVADMEGIYPGFTQSNNTDGSVVGAILITQSGSEGISLKNVRQVHMLEPYWNYIRIRQVIGRAVRAHSHKALPEEERKVQVYLYRIKFARHHVPIEPMTSDEVVYEIANRKNMMLGSLTDIMKRAALDCMVNKTVHERLESFACINDV